MASYAEKLKSLEITGSLHLGRDEVPESLTVNPAPKRSGKQRRFLTMFVSQGGLCHYCKKRMILGGQGKYHPRQATRDHKVARSRGGSNHPDNIVLACRECNETKGGMSSEDFLGFRRRKVFDS